MRIELNLSLRDFSVIQLTAVILLLLLGAATYAFMHFTGHDYVLGFLRLLDVGKERSFATYFSALNLLLASLFLLTILRVREGIGFAAIDLLAVGRAPSARDVGGRGRGHS